MMKRLKQPTTIYVDMDGVIADFFSELARTHGVSHWKELPDRESSITALQGTDFFARLPKFETSDALIEFVDILTEGTWNILSSPLRGDHKNSAFWKKVWLKDNSYEPNEAIFTGRKESYATNVDGSPNILIDDKPSNIERWVDKGGIGIMYQANESDFESLKEEIHQAYFTKVPANERKVVV